MYKLLIALMCILSIAVGCSSSSDPTKSRTTERSITDTCYFTMDDFSTIVIGESSVYDVIEIAGQPSSDEAVLSGVLEYPTAEGRFIQIRTSFFKVQSIELSETSFYAKGESSAKLYLGRLFSLEDFASLKLGVSTIDDLLEITPGYLWETFHCGDVFRYPAEDNKYIVIVCTPVVEAIYLSKSFTFNESEMRESLRNS